MGEVWGWGLKGGIYVFFLKVYRGGWMTLSKVNEKYIPI
jgi:hypothetical protein